MRVWSFAGGLFLRDSVVEGYLPTRTLIRGRRAGSAPRRPAPLLTLDEIRGANTRDGLHLAVFPMPLGQYDWNGPEVTELRKLAPQAFVHFYGGYRLRRSTTRCSRTWSPTTCAREATGCSTTSRSAPAPGSRPRVQAAHAAPDPRGTASGSNEHGDADVRSAAPRLGSRGRTARRAACPRWRFRPVDCRQARLSTETVRSSWRASTTASPRYCRSSTRRNAPPPARSAGSRSVASPSTTCARTCTSCGRSSGQRAGADRDRAAAGAEGRCSSAPRWRWSGVDAPRLARRSRDLSGSAPAGATATARAGR